MNLQIVNERLSCAEILAYKASSREAHIKAVRFAAPNVLDEAAQRIKASMRKPEGARRQRIPAPSFMF